MRDQLVVADPLAQGLQLLDRGEHLVPDRRDIAVLPATAVLAPCQELRAGAQGQHRELVRIVAQLLQQLLAPPREADRKLQGVTCDADLDQHEDRIGLATQAAHAREDELGLLAHAQRLLQIAANCVHAAEVEEGRGLRAAVPASPQQVARHIAFGKRLSMVLQAQLRVAVRDQVLRPLVVVTELVGDLHGVRNRLVRLREALLLGVDAADGVQHASL
mmetsp:Transcript_2583/g.6639  ORF Transcript_2583/g.6639 Transcript_2583/m.6639 type:complete len:218 (+) Transcript_2583:927-1580(+)